MDTVVQKFESDGPFRHAVRRSIGSEERYRHEVWEKYFHIVPTPAVACCLSITTVTVFFVGGLTANMRLHICTVHVEYNAVATILMHLQGCGVPVLSLLVRKVLPYHVQYMHYRWCQCRSYYAAAMLLPCSCYSFECVYSRLLTEQSERSSHTSGRCIVTSSSRSVDLRSFCDCPALTWLVRQFSVLSISTLVMHSRLNNLCTQPSTSTDRCALQNLTPGLARRHGITIWHCGSPPCLTITLSLFAFC